MLDINELNEKYLDHISTYEQTKDPTMLDEARHVKKVIADVLMVGKAFEGSAMAIVELYKDCKVTHHVKDLDRGDIDMTLEEIEKQTRRQNYIKELYDVQNIDDVFEGVKTGRLNFAQAKELNDILKFVEIAELEKRLNLLENGV